MLKQLLAVFTGDFPLQSASKNFTIMLELTQEMVLESSAVYWGKKPTPEERTALYEKDVQVNKLERRIRKAVVAHMTGPVRRDVPYALLLMSLVKDVERLGDYAKNLSEVPGFAPCELPDDALVGELREVARAVVVLVKEAARVYSESDVDRARELTGEGRGVTKRCDQLIRDVAKSDYPAATVVYITIGTRFYKRMESHLLNLLSSVLMPLHKLDYYDEKALSGEG